MPVLNTDYLHWIAVALGLLAAITGALHALFHKRDSRSAFAWVAVCLMWPVVGSAIYLLFGKNRIATRAQRLHGNVSLDEAAKFVPTELASNLTLGIVPHYISLVALAEAVSRRRLQPNNRLEPLCNGEQAYPAMLDAIDRARDCVYLATYIFDRGGVGARFVDALERAHRRGVMVRVLVDGVGALYSLPSVVRTLRRRGVPTARYLPPTLLPPSLTINLRNHRKLLLVDGAVAFTGGMNIRTGHLVETVPAAKAVVDLHFRLHGPVVEQLEEVFLTDWRFASATSIEAFAPRLSIENPEPATASCRVIEDGPNEDLDKLPRVLLAAIAVARERVCIMTPYFLPPRELELALQSAALRGVSVEVMVPARNNLKYVKWASYHAMGDLLAAGVQILLYPRRFNHTKLLAIDGYYVQLGSANLDQRSLRLNFEVTVEVYDNHFGGAMADHFDECRRHCLPLTQQTLRQRPLPMRFLSAVCWLMSPYL